LIFEQNSVNFTLLLNSSILNGDRYSK